MAKDPAAVSLGQRGGQSRSAKKIAASRANGAKQGRKTVGRGPCAVCRRTVAIYRDARDGSLRAWMHAASIDGLGHWAGKLHVCDGSQGHAVILPA